MSRSLPLRTVVIGGVFVLILSACGDSRSPAAPETAIPAVVPLAISACAEWSCESGDCREDPAVYGACCILAADPGQPAAPRPSCGSPSYCQLYPSRCVSGSDTNHYYAPPAYCYNAYSTRDPALGPSACYDRVRSDTAFAEAIHNDCLGITWDYFPACFWSAPS